MFLKGKKLIALGGRERGGGGGGGGGGGSLISASAVLHRGSVGRGGGMFCGGVCSCCCCCSVPQLNTLRATQYVHSHPCMCRYSPQGERIAYATVLMIPPCILFVSLLNV